MSTPCYRVLGEHAKPQQFEQYVLETMHRKERTPLHVSCVQVGQIDRRHPTNLECDVVVNHISHDEETGNLRIEGHILDSQPRQKVRVTLADRITKLTLVD